MSVCFFVVLFIFGRYGVEDIKSPSLFNAGYFLMAMLLAIVLFACGLLDRTQKKATRRVFFMLLVFDFLAMAADSSSYFLDGRPALRNAQLFGETVAYGLDYLMYYLAVVYIMQLLELDREKLSIIMRRMFAVPCFILSGLAVLNLFMPVFFWVDENGIYSIGPLALLNTCFKAVIPVIFIIIAVVYRKRLNGYHIAALMVFTVAILILVLVDMFADDFYLDYGVILLLVLIMYVILNLQNGNKGAVTQMEFDTAKKIQTSILPNLFPDFVDVPEFEIYALMTPAREVGGDFYDFFMLDENRIAFLIGDVTSHDVGGALFMAVSKSMLNMGSQLGGTPADVLNGVNKRFKDADYQSMKARVWLGFLDTRTGHLVYTGAGIPRLAVQDQEVDGKFRFELFADTPPLGEAANPGYLDQEVNLVPGDRIFLYTEGVPSSLDASKERFGEERLLAVLNENLEKDNETLLKSVQQSVDDFIGAGHQTSDITMLGFTFKRPKEEVTA